MTRKRVTRSRIRLLGAVLLAVATLATPVTIASARQAPTCDPDIVLLPLLEGHVSSVVYAMNDQGWAVGTSRAPTSDGAFIRYSKAVLWRDGDVIDLGIGGRLTREERVVSVAVDVNEAGVVAAQWRRYVDSDWVGASSWLWDDGTATRLEVGGQRRFAVVRSLNDHGVAVGYVSDFPTPGSARPAVWRDGQQIRLPVPPGARGVAFRVNNSDLVVGWTQFPRSERRRWYWQLGGTSGPLPDPDGYQRSLIDLDNQDRILASAISPESGPRGYLWDGPQSLPQLVGNHAFAFAWDMNDDGDVTGYRGGFLGVGTRAWVSQLGAETVTELPSPQGRGNKSAMGLSVIRGVTWFAPDGGVSVGGVSGGVWTDGGLATIWTCTQTY